ncbi:LamG-like jellyroll fold domain-containing protein [Xanthocytophaga agilis]|uniref:DUF6443 domain-containing protein n=1 Tax=Xanthocytophaga agilis TaxID=3048010 RepID=A0AAE3RBQ3_9BACT|nr:LamG-like jellyroll fold domain-containing protein [Xanthocytophaga agilis]MDJ1505189.1 DUF6443 domain-containing protein [Xanthocytophaga agilis]
MLSSIQITKQTLFFRKYYQLGRLPIGILVLVLCWSGVLGGGWATYAQSVPKELNLNSYQSPARASEKITLYPGAGTAGVVIPAGLDLDMQIVAPVSGEVPASENAIITTVANQVISVGECASLSATASSNAGNALLLDGVNDFVQVGTIAALKFTTTASFEAWIYPTGAGSHATAGGVILSKEGEYLLARFPNGTIQCAFANTTPGWGWINTGVVAPLNTWSHVAVSYQNGVIKTYLNGTLANTYTGTGVIGDAATTQNDFRIGGRQGTSQYFAGQIDEVKVWSVERSETDIKSAYQQKTDPASANLVGYWSMDNSDLSAQVPNLVTNGAAGTLFNGAARVSSTVSLQATSSAVVWTVDGNSPALPEREADGSYRLCELTEGTYRYKVSLANDNTNSKIVETVTITVKGALPAVGLPAETDRNFVVENTVFKAGQQDENTIKNLSAKDLSQKISYLDGLGRSLQSVVVQGAPEIDGKRNDIVSFAEYDPFGREVKKYLPYTAAGNSANPQLHFQGNALSSQQPFYDQLKGEGAAFAETVYESSPLNRVLAQGAVGTDWQIKNRTDLNHTDNKIVRMVQRTNLENEVRLWSYDPASGTAFSQSGSNGYYSFANSNGQNEGQLLVSETTDEHGKKVIEYTDKKGQVVCKRVQSSATPASLASLTESQTSGWATTYYIYDDFGLLRYVIPPKATDALASVNYSFDFNAEFTKTWLFAYDYDERHRMIRKRVPGGGLSQMVYNRRDEVVLTQSALQGSALGYKPNSFVQDRITNQWNFTKYDALGRVVMTGTWIAPVGTTRQDLQNQVNSQAQVWETRNTETITASEIAESKTGYSHEAFPNTGFIPQTIHFYDDYSFLPVESALAYNTQVIPSNFDQSADNQLLGKATGTYTSLLETSVGQTVKGLVSVNYYDSYSRVIQTLAENHQGGIDISSIRYDFSGKVLETLTRHQNPDALDQSRQTLTIRTRTQYDHAGRIIASYQKIGTGVEEKLAASTYNALGEMIKKKLGQYSPAYSSTSSEGNALQTVDYKYNIRGWMTSINGGTLTGGDSDDKFALALSYNTPLANGEAQFNGNISSQKWISRADGIERSYNYFYDAMNRITSASYVSTKSGEHYDMPLVSYDKNGNIDKLTRLGMIAGTSSSATGWGEVDKLSYSYDGNRLFNVKDEGQYKSVGLAGDFKDGTAGDASIEYNYDEAGNMFFDDNKGIQSILYNQLNLPTYIQFQNGNTISYFYTAAGVKYKKTTSTGSKTDYIGGMVYENRKLQFVPTAEGRALPPELAGTTEFAYEYHYKDHLGNLRVAFREAARVAPFYATMEDSRKEYEESQFENLTTTRNGENPRTGVKSAKLYSSASSPTTAPALGPWKTLYVKKGDKIEAEVFANYASNGSAGTPVGLFASLGNTANSTPVAGSETNKNIFTNLQIGLSHNFAMPQAGAEPVGYLKMLIYDKNYQLTSARIRQVTEVAEEGWEELHLSYVAQEDGYVQILVANESQSPVWFDDIKVSYTKDLIVQENHYDPWGLNLVGIETQGNPNHKLQYNGIEKEESFGLNWNMADFRVQDPQLGRLWQIDPIDKEDQSPYSWVVNNPMLYSDPSGLDTTIHLNDLPNNWNNFNTNEDVVQLPEVSVTPTSADDAINDENNDAKLREVQKIYEDKAKAEYKAGARFFMGYPDRVIREGRMEGFKRYWASNWTTDHRLPAHPSAIGNVNEDYVFFEILTIIGPKGVYNILKGALGRHGGPITYTAGASLSKRMTPDQEALKDLVYEATLKGTRALSPGDTRAVIELAEEIGYPGFRATASDMVSVGNHWVKGPHIHLPGAVKGGHVQITP